MRATEKFKRDLRGMMAGDRGMYHRGLLAVARSYDTSIDQIATLLMRLYELGYVLLWQVRDAEGVMTYNYAIRERITRERIEEAENLGAV